MRRLNNGLFVTDFEEPKPPRPFFKGVREMPVLDLDDFLKKNAAQKASEPQAPAPKTASQSPFAAFTGASSQDANKAFAGDLLDFRQKTEGALALIGQDFLKLSGRVTALERNAESAQSKTEQLIAIIDRARPDKTSAEISDLRAQLSSIRATGAPATQDAGVGTRVPGPEVSGAVRRLETEYIEMSSRLRPMEVALEQLKAWADRDKDYFIKTDEAHNKLSELERKIALKSDYPSEQIMSRAQFEKYSKMADLDRQQLRLSVDSLRDTVSQVSASVDRLNSMAAGGHAFYPTGSMAATGVEARLDAHDKAFAELRTNTDATGLDKYSKELEKTRAEVSANYEQVKAVERLLTAQSNKMQSVFSEIQKNLSEYKLTSDTLNSTHEAVLQDISSLKAEHEHGIEDYRRIAAELSQKVEQNARAVSEMHLMINGLQYATSQTGGLRAPGGEAMQDTGTFRAEQKRLLDETNALSATVADLAKKAAAFQEQAAKIARMEETALRVEHKVKESEANNAALFANITTGFSELKKRLEATGAVQDAGRMATVEKGFSDLGSKVNSIEQDNAALFANLSKSVSKLKAQVDALQAAAPASHQVSASPDGRVVFAGAETARQADGTLLSRIDALEKSISSLRLPALNAQIPPGQFSATPESASGNMLPFENRLARLESFKGELDEWKAQAEDISAKIGALDSSHAQLVQEVASVISEKQSIAYADDQFSKTQAEESKALLNELKVQTELLSSKLAATESNVSAIIGQRFSQLQTQADRTNADLVALKAVLPEKTDVVAASEERQAKALSAVDSRLSQSIEERFARAQQATGQQALEFAVFRDAVPEKIRLAVTAAESRQADAISAVDAKVAKFSTESDKLRDFVGKAAADTEKNVQDSRTALNEIRARSDELAAKIRVRSDELEAKIAGFSSSQAQFVQDLSGTIDDRFSEAQQSIESTAAALSGKITQFETAQADTLAGFEASQLQLLAQFESRQDAKVGEFESSQSQMLAAFEAKQSQALSALDSKQAEESKALLSELKVQTEGLAAALNGRMDTTDAFSRSISDLLSTTKAEVSTEVAGLRKAQESASASASEGLARFESSTGQLSSSLSETNKGVSALRLALDERSSRQEQELAAVKTSNALLEQKVAGLLAALEKVAALSRELDSERTEVRNTVKDLRAALNEQASAQVAAEQRKLAEVPVQPEQQDAKARQAALESDLSDLEKAIAEIESKMPAAPAKSAAVFERQPPQQGVPRPAIPPAPQQRPRQEYYSPQAEQPSAREQQARRPAQAFRPVQQRPAAPRTPAQQYPGASDAADAAQTAADKQAMELMEELREKLLGEGTPKAEKKEAKAEEKEQQ